MKKVTEEEAAAVAVLAKHGRLLVIMVPEDAPDEFVARLTAWSNFILDTKIMLPLPLPTALEGDGLVCPYCKVPSSSNPSLHADGCEWREAILRWGGAQLQIDEQFLTKES